ncbi:MAG: nucleotidyltransferase [Clostridia bacterium]
MGKVLGIIAEYSPFHNGHLYHLVESKNRAGAEAVICVISGNFMQRGIPSVIDKWTKTEMALLCGADLVIELPTVYSISSAENFAQGAIKILNSLKLIDTISFGSETSDIQILDKFASVLYQEPKEYVSILNHELSKGFSYPKARENALLMYLNDIRKYANVLSSPNNILGIEYLKALKRLKSPITPMTIKREKVGYHDNSTVNGFASATAIRKMITQEKFKEIQNVVPENIYSILEEKIKKGNTVPGIERFEKEILYTFRKMSLSQIAELPDVNEGLEHSIKKAASSCNNIKDFITIVKSKRYTQTRIQRIALYALLGITKKDIAISQKVTPYIRVLGFNSIGKHLISEINLLNPKLDIIVSVKRYLDIISNKNLKRLLETDILATDMYTLGYEYDSWANLDFTKKVVELKDSPQFIE